MSIDLILFVVAAVCFALAVFGVGSKFNLMAAGLFFWVLTNII